MHPLPLRLTLVYDFRNPPDSGIPTATLYAEMLGQVAWLDTLGLDLVWFTEHHFVDDGYLPSWTPVAGAMAARTSRVRFSSDICLLPFSHPVRLPPPPRAPRPAPSVRFSPPPPARPPRVARGRPPPPARAPGGGPRAGGGGGGGEPY